MYIRKFTYKKEDLDCKLCTEYRGKKHSCPHDVCPFIAERIEAGAVTYWDAVSALIPAQYRCSRRLPKLADEYPGTFFLDERHRSRMEFLNTQLGYVPGRNTPAYYATMYLLTSNEVIHWAWPIASAPMAWTSSMPFSGASAPTIMHCTVPLWLSPRTVRV